MGNKPISYNLWCMLVVKNSRDMEVFGEKLGKRLRGGEVIELIGDVGAGKTTLVRGVARGLEIDETIASPSFTVSRVYEARDGIRLFHYDFYRLLEPGIMADELEETAQDDRHVVVIEWGESVKRVLPSDRLILTIAAIDESTREVKISATGPRSSSMLEVVA